MLLPLLAIKNCPSILQHSFPKQFLEKLKSEFCLEYLNTKVCDKNFPPHFCLHIQHCYVAGPLVKFYKDFYNRVIKEHQNCQQKAEGAATKKVSAGSREAVEPPKKSAETRSAPSKISSRTEFLILKAPAPIQQKASSTHSESRPD